MRGEDGMTLVEVMVAMVVLVVGVLGVVAMLDTGNRATAQNLTREAGTNLAREELERARQIAYTDLADPAKVAAALAPAVEGSDPPASTTFTTRRRGVTYTTTISTCVLDDPSDGIGGAPGTPCVPLPPGSGGGGTVPGGTGTPPPLQLNVLGIPITGGGLVLEAVCNLLGRNSVLDGLLGATSGTLGPLVTGGADSRICRATDRQVAFDRQPADVTRVRTNITWAHPRPGRVVQHAVVSGPRVVPAS